MSKIVVEKSRRWPYLHSDLVEPMDLRPVVGPCWKWEPNDRASILECCENVIRLVCLNLYISVLLGLNRP